jgi:branched-chain amino acid transport system ATP-binding protein
LPEHLLEVEGLHTYIGQHHILQGVSLGIRPDAVTVLLGRNGAGKTTTMRTIMGLLHPRQGAIRFDGRPIHHLPPYEIARLGIGYVPEGQGIFATLTVDETRRAARGSTASSISSPTSTASAAPARARSPEARSRCSPSRGPSSTRPGSS